MIKKLAKKVIPASLWRKVRRRRIIADQDRTAKLCDSYIEKYFDGGEILFKSRKKADLEGKKIIWQYWAQGFDSDLPEVVRVCLASVERFKGDYEIIRLSDETIADYVDLPEFVWQKRGHGFSVTGFSNVLRLALLYLYGGVWIDATVLLTKTIPDKYSGYDFFMYRRDESEPHKEYWENSYAYYFGWGEDFRVRVLTSIAFAKAGGSFVKDYLNTLLHVWNENDIYPFYFTFQVLFNQLVASGKSDPGCPIESDCPPHCLMQVINDGCSFVDLKQLCQEHWAHKLTYKEMDIDRFRSVLSRITE